MRRREIEQKIIAAARKVVEVRESGAVGWLPEALGFQIAMLKEWIKELDVTVEEPEKPRTAAIAPPTAHDAGKAVRPGTLRAKILLCLSSTRRTTDELLRLLDRPHQSVSARVNELERAGWIMPSGATRATRSGRQATVWQLTDEARNQLAERWHGAAR